MLPGLSYAASGVAQAIQNGHRDLHCIVLVSGGKALQFVVMKAGRKACI